MTSRIEQSSGVNHQRKANWRTLLDDYINRSRTRQFEYGSHDCLTFALRWERLVTTNSRFLDAFFVYNSKEEAQQLICEHGMYDVWEVISSRLDMKPRTFAQKGDLVAHVQRGQRTVGICLGRYFVAPGAKKIMLRSMDRAEFCWKV